MTPGLLRVRLLTGVLWALVLGSLVASVLALTTPRATAAPPTPAAAPVPPGVGGFAAAYLTAFLSADPVSAADELRPWATGLPRWQGPAPDPAPTPAAVPAPEVLHVSPAGPGRWAVLLAEPEDPRRAWAVTVAGDAGGWVAEGTPRLVPAPAPPPAHPSALPPPSRPAPDDAVAHSVGRFLAALLAGDGEVGRYTAPGSPLTPLHPAPYTAVELTGMASADVGANRRVVAAEVRASRDDGTAALLQYPLLVAVRDGRWEVVEILPALPRAAPGDERRTSPTTRPR